MEDILPIKLDRLISDEYNKYINIFYSQDYVVTNENGIKYISSESSDELVVEELRFPLELNVNRQIKKINYSA